MPARRRRQQWNLGPSLLHLALAEHFLARVERRPDFFPLVSLRNSDELDVVDRTPALRRSVCNLCPHSLEIFRDLAHAEIVGQALRLPICSFTCRHGKRCACLTKIRWHNARFSATTDTV